MERRLKAATEGRVEGSDESVEREVGAVFAGAVRCESCLEIAFQPNCL